MVIIFMIICMGRTPWKFSRSARGEINREEFEDRRQSLEAGADRLFNRYRNNH
jgi:hypothetical protein